MNFVLMMNCKAKKIIKFKLGGRSHNLTLLEFAHRLGLYLADELDEDGFNVYFEGGFHSDEHFNSQEYWLSISREENIGLSRSHTSTIRSPILRVIHKMITYGLCQRMTGSAGHSVAKTAQASPLRTRTPSFINHLIENFALTLAIKENLVMSDSEHSTVSYTSISSYSDLSAWGIPLMDADEVPEMDPYEELEEDPKEDPVDYAPDTNVDEDEEEESSKYDDDEEEDHLAPSDSTAVASPIIDHVPSTKETEPFETNESTATPPPPPAYQVARLFALPTLPPSPLTLLSSPLPQIPSQPLHVPSPPTTSPTYTEAPLGYKAARIRLRAASPPLLLPSTSHRADILEANIPPQKRLLLTACTPRVDYNFVDTVDASIRASERRTMKAIEMVNLRRNHAALRGEVDTLRRYLSSLCTNHKQERVEAHQALARFEAHKRALEAQITVLKIQAHCHKWQRQDADDHATGHIMRIQALEAGE
ncbi:hypothetical protein Tco_0204456 [Tanacetum coccineum]